MKYADFVKEVEKYGWEKTRFQGHAFSVVGPVAFVHHDSEEKEFRMEVPNHV